MLYEVKTCIGLIKNHRAEMSKDTYESIMTDIAVCTFDTNVLPFEKREDVPNTKEWNDYATEVYKLAEIDN